MYVLIIHLYFQWQMNKSTICRHHPPMGIWRLLTIRLCVFMWSHTELLSQSGRSQSTLMGLHLEKGSSSSFAFCISLTAADDMSPFQTWNVWQCTQKYSLPLDGNNSGHNHKHGNSRNDKHISGKCCPIFCETKAMWEQVNMWHKIIYTSG